MGVFEFIIALVLITTIGKVLSERRAAPRIQPPASPPRSAEIVHLRESVTQLSARLERLEEERDFYRQLLESPKRDGSLPRPPGSEGTSRES
jgi:hypothetical protein